jgi:anti-anti-sigma factor
MTMAAVQEWQTVGEAALAVDPGGTADERHLELTGELDLATAPAFLGALALALHARPALVELDLRRLTFIDAQCAGAIATASMRVSGWGGTLVARAPQSTVRRVFELCGVEDLLWPRATCESSPPA